MDERLAMDIQAAFGVTPEERNAILFDCGGWFASRLRMLGVSIVEDAVFWDEFTKLFCDDDLYILRDWESHQRDYAAMKEAVVTDPVFEHKLLERVGRATALFDCVSRTAEDSPSRPAKPKPAPAKSAELDKWRKRLMAAVGGYLTLRGEAVTGDRIKAVACRAARKDGFNRIGVSQLRSLYNAFVKQQNDIRRVNQLNQ